MPVAAAHFPELLAAEALILCEHDHLCLLEADALLVLTEWPPYRHPDLERIHQLLRHPVVFDGRNLWKPERMREMGFRYISIGRPAVGAAAGSRWRGAHEGGAGRAA
jgi:UDPglucose 6-dehydrogenase